MSIFTPENGTPRDGKNDTRTFAYTARGGSILAKMAFDPVEVGDVAEEPAHSARSIPAGLDEAAPCMRPAAGERDGFASGGGVVGQPVRDMEKFPHRRQRVELLHGAMPIHGGIAEAIDEHRLGKDRRARCGFERRLVDERAQVVLIRQLERRIVLVESTHHQLKRTPRLETRRSRIGIRKRLRLARGVMQVGPFGSKEGEVAHEVRLMRLSRSRTVARIFANVGGVARNISRIAW